MTRSWPHFLLGRMCVLSQSIRQFTFESSWLDAFSAQDRICLSNANSLAEGSLKSNEAASTASLVASSYSESSA